MGGQILAVLLVILVLVGIVLLAINDPSAIPANSRHPAAADLYQAQAAARATATVATAQEAGANAMVDAAHQATTEALQATAEAQRAAQAAADATRQAQVDATAAVVAAAESTRQATLEEIALQATLEAGRALATDAARSQIATVQAQHVQATESARSTSQAALAHAVATAESATATAEYVAPTRTIVASDTETYLTSREWERRTAPWKEIGKAAFWTALGVLTLLACAWVFPRAWIALQMRFLRVKEDGDGPEWMVIGAQGLIKAWSGAFQATSYNSDRDRGPGQTLDPYQEAGLLPGGDPRVTERDQIVQGLTRPVQAAAAAGDSGSLRRASRRPGAAGGTMSTRNPLAAIPGVSSTGRRAYRVIPPGASLPPPVRRALDAAVVAHLDNDWRVEDA